MFQSTLGEDEEVDRVRIAEALGVEQDELLATSLETSLTEDDNMKNSLEDIFGMVQEDTLRNLDYTLSYTAEDRHRGSAQTAGGTGAEEVHLRKRRQSEDDIEDMEDSDEYNESPPPAPALLPNLLSDPVGSVIRLLEDFFVKAIGRFINVFLT